jgi:hypothetical protein
VARRSSTNRIGTGTRITDALPKTAGEKGCILDLELAADGSVARARRRYPNCVASNYPETHLYSAGLWGDHLVLVGTTDPQSTFLDVLPRDRASIKRYSS